MGTDISELDKLKLWEEQTVEATNCIFQEISNRTHWTDP